VAATSAIEMLRTPYHAPRANAICERFLRSVRQECLDHLFILHEMQLQRVLNGYVAYFNRARPHQGIRQQIPELLGEPLSSDHHCGTIVSCSVLGGLHHNYTRASWSLENTLRDGEIRQRSIVTWFRPGSFSVFEAGDEETGMLLHCWASLLLLAEVGKDVLCFFLYLNCISSQEKRPK